MKSKSVLSILLFAAALCLGLPQESQGQAAAVLAVQFADEVLLVRHEGGVFQPAGRIAARGASKGYLTGEFIYLIVGDEEVPPKGV